VIFPEPITCKIAERIGVDLSTPAAPAALLAMLQTALRIEGASEFEVRDSSLRFRMAGWGGSWRSNWHWSAYVSSGEVTLTHAANAYMAVGRLRLWRLGIFALVPPGLILLVGTPVWLAILAGIGLWLIGFWTTKASFQGWIGGVFRDVMIGDHRGAVAP
jgi:hypothetical protein